MYSTIKALIKKNPLVYNFIIILIGICTILLFIYLLYYNPKRIEGEKQLIKIYSNIELGYSKEKVMKIYRDGNYDLTMFNDLYNGECIIEPIYGIRAANWILILVFDPELSLISIKIRTYDNSQIHLPEFPPDKMKGVTH